MKKILATEERMRRWEIAVIAAEAAKSAVPAVDVDRDWN